MVIRPKSLRIAFRSFLAKLTRAITIFTAFLAIIAISDMWSTSISVSAELSRGEYELKAAFLYNFIKFTEWPAEELKTKDQPFVIGVLGKDPFGAALDKVIEGETIQNRPILARRFAKMDESVTNSQVLFISGSEENNLPAIPKLLDGQPVLTVSDIETFVQHGGIIKLKKESNKIVFEINLDAAKRAGLAMNAQLLKLAKTVKK